MVNARPEEVESYRPHRPHYQQAVGRRGVQSRFEPQHWSVSSCGRRPRRSRRCRVDVRWRRPQIGRGLLDHGIGRRGGRGPERRPGVSRPPAGRPLDRAAGSACARCAGRRAALLVVRHRDHRQAGCAEPGRAGYRGTHPRHGRFPVDFPAARHHRPLSARYFGADDRAAAVREGAQATWLALGLGALIVAVVQVAAVPLVSIIAGSHDIANTALSWLRIAIVGAPAILVSLAGNGWLRGVQDTVRPLRYVIAGFGLSALLCPLLVYGWLGLPHLGLAGSAVANLAGQWLAAVLFGWALLVERFRTDRPDRVACASHPGSRLGGANLRLSGVLRSPPQWRPDRRCGSRRPSGGVAVVEFPCAGS